MDDVVAFVAVQEVGKADVGTGVGDDVVAFAAEHLVDAVASLDRVVAALAPDGVVAAAGHDDIVALGPANREVLVAVDADIFRNAVVIGVDTLDQLREASQERIVGNGICTQLFADIHLKRGHVERGEEVARQRGGFADRQGQCCASPARRTCCSRAR